MLYELIKKVRKMKLKIIQIFTINIIRNDTKKKNKSNYKNGKYIWEDGKYYISEFKK